MALSEAAIAAMLAEAERLTPMDAAMLAIADALADALTEAAALADALAEADKAAERLAAAFGASRFTPSWASTVAETASSMEREPRFGMVGMVRLAKGREFSRLTMAESWA